jgi:hypothetical protein
MNIILALTCSWLKTWENALFIKEKFFFATGNRVTFSFSQIRGKSVRYHGIAELWYKNLIKLFLSTFTFAFVVDNGRPSLFIYGFAA